METADSGSDIDPDIMNMVAAMCGDYSSSSNPIITSNYESSKADQDMGRKCLERSRKRKQTRPSKYPMGSSQNLPQITKNGLGSPTKKIRKIGENHPPDADATDILFLLEKKKKLVKKDGLYKFVLWREALRD